MPWLRPCSRKVWLKDAALRPLVSEESTREMRSSALVAANLAHLFIVNPVASLSPSVLDPTPNVRTCLFEH